MTTYVAGFLVFLIEQSIFRSIYSVRLRTRESWGFPELKRSTLIRSLQTPSHGFQRPPGLWRVEGGAPILSEFFSGPQLDRVYLFLFFLFSFFFVRSFFVQGISMPNSTHATDVIVIGAGPVGLFAVFQCGMLGLKCHVVDALDVVGGQCAALYPEKPIFDIPAHPSITGGTLIDKLMQQITPFQPVFHLGQQAVSLSQAPNNAWTVKTSHDLSITAQAVIIAAGAGAFGPNRPPLDNIRDFEGHSVFYMVRRRQDFAGRRVVIAGGGDSAVDWALSLVDIAESVMVIHRRAKFRAAPESIRQLEALACEGRLELVTPYQLSGLEGGDGRLTAVRVATLDGEERRLDADVLLALFGLATDLGPIASWGLALAHHHIPVTPSTCATSAPGLFAVGDIANYPGKLKLILTGFAEAAHAAHAAYSLVRPGEVIHFEHSTSKGLPGRD
ncbi:Ferredoxin--NADP reductase (modular protein) [Azospirillaceae bacterium]